MRNAGSKLPDSTILQSSTAANQPPSHRRAQPPDAPAPQPPGHNRTNANPQQKKPPIPTMGIRGGDSRGSTLIYHCSGTWFAPGRTFPTHSPSGLSADDPDSLRQCKRYSFRSTRYSISNTFYHQNSTKSSIKPSYPHPIPRNLQTFPKESKTTNKRPKIYILKY